MRVQVDVTCGAAVVMEVVQHGRRQCVARRGVWEELSRSSASSWGWLNVRGSGLEGAWCAHARG